MLFIFYLLILIDKITVIDTNFKMAILKKRWFAFRRKNINPDYNYTVYTYYLIRQLVSLRVLKDFLRYAIMF